jgi:drug/metabolite transporter (DMT)-like permease
MTSTKNKNPFLIWGLLIILALIWGSSFILIKKGLDVYPPEQLGSLRMIIAFLSLVVFVLPHFSKITFYDWKWVFIAGMLGNFIPAYLFAVAETGLDSSITGVVNALVPLFVVLWGLLLFAQHITRRQALGIIVAFSGVLALTFIRSGGSLAQVNGYVLLVVLATVCYGLNVNIIKYKLAHLPPVLLTGFAFVSIAPFALIHLFGFTDFVELTLTADKAWLSLTYIAILAVVGTALALVLFNKLIQLTSPIFTSMVTYLIPIVAIGWGVLDGEIISSWEYLTMLLIIVGVYIVNNKKRIKT